MKDKTKILALILFLVITLVYAVSQEPVESWKKFYSIIIITMLSYWTGRIHGDKIKTGRRASERGLGEIPKSSHFNLNQNV